MLWDEAEDPTISYRTLAERARAVALGLLRRKVEPGDRIAIMLPTGADFFRSFYGILYAGAVPVPIYPPMRPSQIEDHLRRQGAILDNAGAVGLITVREARPLGPLLKSQVESLRFVETPEEDRGSRNVPARSAWGSRLGPAAVHLGQHRQPQGRHADALEPSC